VEVDTEQRQTLSAGNMHSRCGWTPFEGMEVTGVVTRVVLRGREAVRDGKVIAEPGWGNVARPVA